MSATREAQKKEKLTSQEMTEYRSLVGSLNWIVQGTRPDLAFEMIESSTKFKSGTVADLIHIKKILQKAKMNLTELYYPSLGPLENWQIVVFTDASLCNLNAGVDSCMGYLVFLTCQKGNSCPLVWRANKIRRVVKSTIAAESLGCLEGIEEALYIRQILFQVLNITDAHAVPIIVYVDHKGAVESMHSTKLVEDRRLRVDIASIKQYLERREVSDIYACSGDDQIADCLTKKGASGVKLRAALQEGSINLLAHHH